MSIVTIGFAILALGFAFWVVAAMWRRVASAYPCATLPPVRASKSLQIIVIVANRSRVKFHKYVPVTIGVHDSGLSMRMPMPFGLFAPPFLIPFAETSLRPSYWYLNAACHALDAARSDCVIMMDDDLVEWLRLSAPALRFATLPVASGADDR